MVVRVRMVLPPMRTWSVFSVTLSGLGESESTTEICAFCGTPPASGTGAR